MQLLGPPMIMPSGYIINHSGAETGVYAWKKNININKASTYDDLKSWVSVVT